MPARRRNQEQPPSHPLNPFPSQPPSAGAAFADMFEAYDRMLGSIRGYDGRPAEATQLERIALMNRVRKRFAVNAKMPPGYSRALTVRESAHKLGVSIVHVRRLIKAGRLNPAKVDGLLYIPPEEVRAYKRQQEIWAAQGGRWTPFGREEKKDPRAPYVPIGPDGPEEDPDDGGVEPWRPTPNTEHPTPNTDSDDPTTQQWITTKEAAAILNLTKVMTQRIIKQRGIETRMSMHGRGGGFCTYRLADIMRLVDERESRTWKRGISPQQWKHDLRHPHVRTKLEPPPGDRLISRREAAEFLGVREVRITNLVGNGTLFGWQQQPGKPGVPLFLSERQVIRYNQDPMRLKRRAAKVEGSAPPELMTGNDWTEWREWHDLVRHTGAHSDRDRGEFLTTAQAAELLGVCPYTVRFLRARGRLKGYRSERNKRPGPRDWWFFRREDVEDLLADPAYAVRRRRWQKARATLAATRPEPPSITKSYHHDQDDR